MTPTGSIVIPTRGRAGYLDVALSSIVDQARAAGVEVVVVSDGPDPGVDAAGARHGVRVVRLPSARGANAARNAGVAAAGGELIVFCDDDVFAPDGWLAALLEAAAEEGGFEGFGGPIRARLEGGGPRACGREGAPITTLDLGASDREVEFVWSANMAVRRSAFSRVGLFDPGIHGRGEEEEWLRRYRAFGGRVRYVAAAGLEHRRTASDSTLLRLSVAAYGLGRSARRFDVAVKGGAPGVLGELRVLAGCVWHVGRRRCLNGVVLAAHAAGRVREAVGAFGGGAAPGAAVGAGSGRSSSPGLGAGPGPDDDFLSGTSGYVAGVRATSRALGPDAVLDARALARGEWWRLRQAAAEAPRRDVLVLAVERTDRENILAGAREEILRSHHQVQFVSAPAGDRGRFENLNALLADHPPAGFDWLLVLDDDVALPRDFLDCFLFLTERFRFALAQPAHRHRSHAAFAVTRRHPGAVARATGFVEIGPVVAFHPITFGKLVPFPPLRIGWGLDAHWSAVARQQGWRPGVVDATPIRHGLRPIAGAYSRDDALAEAREFLAERPYMPAAQSARTVRTYRAW